MNGSRIGVFVTSPGGCCAATAVIAVLAFASGCGGDGPPLPGARVRTVSPVRVVDRIVDRGTVLRGEQVSCTFRLEARAPCELRNRSESCGFGQVWLHVDGVALPFPFGSRQAVTRDGALVITGEFRSLNPGPLFLPLNLLVIAPEGASSIELLARARVVESLLWEPLEDARMVPLGHVARLALATGEAFAVRFHPRHGGVSAYAGPEDASLRSWSLLALGPEQLGVGRAWQSGVLRIVTSEGRRLWFDLPDELVPQR